MSQDGKDISVTLKAGKDFDAPWIVVYGNRPDEVQAKLENLGGLVEAAVNAANHLKAVNAGSALPAVAQPAAQPWGQQAPQQQAPAQQPQQNQGGQQQGNRYGGPTHPEGKSCHCGKVLEKKNSSGGKGKWQCPDWRWNNGNPNGHDMEWIN